MTHLSIWVAFSVEQVRTLARATRVVIHSILVLGPSARGTGKITSDNGNLRNLRYTKNIRDIGINNIRICTSNYVEQLKPRFWKNSEFF